MDISIVNGIINQLITGGAPPCTIYKAYSLGLCKGISPQNMAKNMVLTYLHFRILKFPLTVGQFFNDICWDYKDIKVVMIIVILIIDITI